MDRNHLNPINYTHIGSFTVPFNGKDLIIPPRTDFAETMLIKWQVNQMSKGVDLSQVGDGLLISEIEVKGFGVLESSTFDIPPSDFRTKRVQLIHTSLELPQTFTFRSSSLGVINSILEFYAYRGIEMEEYINYQSQYMPSSNPVNLDQATLTNAFIAAAPTLSSQIASASAMANSQILAQEFNTETSHSTNDFPFIAKAWTGNAEDHIALRLDDARIGYRFFNRGSQKVYVAIGDAGNKDIHSYIDIVEPGGYYVSTEFDRSLQLILYVGINKADTPVSITELLP